MVIILSYVIAVVITFFIAILLYPVAGLFWVFGLFGKISEVLFKFTSKVIKHLWKDLQNSEPVEKIVYVEEKRILPEEYRADISEDKWVCSCGFINTGKFCEKCGNTRPSENVAE